MKLFFQQPKYIHSFIPKTLQLSQIRFQNESDFVFKTANKELVIAFKTNVLAVQYNDQGDNSSSSNIS